MPSRIRWLRRSKSKFKAATDLRGFPRINKKIKDFCWFELIRIRENPCRSVAGFTLSWLLKVIVLGNLVTSAGLPHTRFTYHRTWETGLEVAAMLPFLTPPFFAPAHSQF